MMTSIVKKKILSETVFFWFTNAFAVFSAHAHDLKKNIIDVFT